MGIFLTSDIILFLKAKASSHWYEIWEASFPDPREGNPILVYHFSLE